MWTACGARIGRDGGLMPRASEICVCICLQICASVFLNESIQNLDLSRSDGVWFCRVARAPRSDYVHI